MASSGLWCVRIGRVVIINPSHLVTFLVDDGSTSQVRIEDSKGSTVKKIVK